MNFIALISEKCLKRTNSFIRFLLVGVINTLTGLSIMLLLLNVFRQSYWISTFLGNSAGASVSYFLNRNFTFNSKANIGISIPRFIIVILVCYMISYMLGTSIVEIYADIYYVNNKLPKENIAVLIGTAIYTVTNYFGQKLYVFRA